MTIQKIGGILIPDKLKSWQCDIYLTESQEKQFLHRQLHKNVIHKYILPRNLRITATRAKSNTDPDPFGYEKCMDSIQITSAGDTKHESEHIDDRDGDKYLKVIYEFVFKFTLGNVNYQTPPPSFFSF